MSDENLNEKMHARAEEAVDVTFNYYATLLDYTEESIGDIEALVAANEIHYSMPGGKNKQNIQMMARLWGAYIGEVFRQHVGGDWIHHEDQYGKTIAFDSSSIKIFPSSKVLKRINGNEADNLESYYTTMRDLMKAQKA